MSKRFDKYIFIFAVVLAILEIVFSCKYMEIRRENSVKETAYCEIVDKYRVTTGARHTSTKYNLTFVYKPKNNEEINKTVSVSSKYWKSVVVGEMILCEVVYDSKGIIDLEIIESQ